MPRPDPDSQAFTLARNAAAVKKFTWFQANPLALVCTLPGGDTFEDAVRVVAQIFAVNSAEDDAPLAEVEELDPGDVGAVTLTFTSAQMNQPVAGRERKFDLVIFAEWADDTAETYAVGEILLRRSKASSLAAEPPTPSLATWESVAARVAAMEADQHTHSNKSVLDLLTAPSGALLYNGSQVGVSSHSGLSGTSGANCHPTSAITGLDAALSGKAAASHTHVSADISDASLGGNGVADDGKLAKFGATGGLMATALTVANASNPNGFGIISGSNLVTLRNFELPNYPGTLMVGALNLSDIADAATSRSNLGLTALATTTPGTGVATFLATPSSANLAAALTDETGTGAAVFATSPALVTPVLGTPASGTLTNCTGLPASGIGSGYISDDRLFPLRPISFAGAYDDDFTAAGLNAKWTRQGLVSGDHTYQTGNGSWMSMSIAAGATGYVARSIHQAWAPADSTITCRLAYQQVGSAYPMMGPFITDGSGNGVAVTIYNNSNSFNVVTLASWVYSATALGITMALPALNIATGATGIWLRLRKSGTTYYASVSYDGLFWGPEVSVVSATTMSRIGMGTFARFGGGSDYGGVQHFDFFKVT